MIGISSTTPFIDLLLAILIKKLARDFGACEAVCLSCDPYSKNLDSIKVLPWKQGIQTYLASS